MKALQLILILLLAPPPTVAAAWDNKVEIDRFIAEMHERHNFDEAELRARFADTEPHPTVLRLIAPPSSPTQRSWQRYRARFLTPQRIGGGVAFWRRHDESVARASTRFGVPPEIIVAIIGVETEYGRNTGSFKVFQALATLAFDYPPRAEFFRGELEQFLLLCRENGIDPATATGSYAGAIGIPQFMPGSQRRFAVDFDDDSRIDLGGVEDAIGSVAAFLAAHGWQPGAAIARQARDGDRAPPQWVAAGIKPSLNAADLRTAGLDAGTLDDDAKLALVDLVTPDAATEYWWGFDNFFVITRYNRSSFYAMAVFQLAEAIAIGRVEGLPATPRKTTAGSRAKRRRGE